MFKQEDYTVVLHEAGDVYNHNTTYEDMNLISSGELAHITSSFLPLLDSDVERNLLSQDDTMDVATKYYVEPVWPRGPPERLPFSGDLNFQVEISASDVHRRKYLYSHRLNRIYVDMKIPFPVTFRWNNNIAVEAGPLFVRATVVFSEESQGEKRVERCTQHTHENNGDTNLTIIKNVLHSAREKNTQGVYYCGQPDQADSWYSVVVEFPTGPGTHAYQFGCKNSCSSGINRRPIDIIFSLEDITGHVYGRQIVGARACSCPKRDMNKDEKDMNKGEEDTTGRQGKRKIEKSGETKVKKVKIDETALNQRDQEAFTLPQLTIIGSQAMLAGLEVMQRMMEQAATLTKDDTPERYTSHIAKLKQYIEGVKKARNH